MKQLFIILSLVFAANTSHAYYTTLDTGETLSPGHFKTMLESNVVFNDLNGLNLVGKLDLGFTESSGFRAILGGGAVGFQTGLLYKWVPIPDYGNQPAIGFLGGAIYARDEGINYMNARFHPFASKRYESEGAILTPFVALPFGVTWFSGRTRYPLQFTLGTEWQPRSLKYWSFIGETAFNLHESYSYIAVAAILRFDEENGVRFE